MECLLKCKDCKYNLGVGEYCAKDHYVTENSYCDEGEIGMLEITFKYKDEFTNGEWKEQSCRVSSVRECIELYGLGVDCEYEFIKIKDEDEKNDG